MIPALFKTLRNMNSHVSSPPPEEDTFLKDVFERVIMIFTLSSHHKINRNTEPNCHYGDHHCILHFADGLENNRTTKADNYPI